jgi:exodeoxyribonuclease VII large subunit
MTEAPPEKTLAHNLPEFTVGELSQALKRTLETTFERVRVRGEISGFKRAASGHLYFSLKDADAVLDAVCWRGLAGRLDLAPEDGLEVIASGRITTYPGRSKYQIVVESLELAGEGALLKMLEDRRRRLAAEGLFDKARKQAIPFLPEVIGVVTSETGAVIRDILHRLADRFPRRVLLWPVLVQGEGAPEQVAAAIHGFNRLAPDGRPPRPDVLIVARGGGSLEDLMAFNEEVVVRAAAESEIPVISAVGHETDWTLIDHASDLRAPTPSAAAEMAVPVRLELLRQLRQNGDRLLNATDRLLAEKQVRLDGLARGLPDLMGRIEERAQRLDDWAERAANAARNLLGRRRAKVNELAARLPAPALQINEKENRLRAETRALEGAAQRLLPERARELAHVGKMLDSLSYARVLERGFVLVRDTAREPVLSATALTPGMMLSLQFHDGEAPARAEGKDEAEGTPQDSLAAPRRRQAKAGGKDDKQGRLL